MAYRRRYQRYSHNAGLEAAKRHIREAEELSRKLGGTDKDVKEYFFSLSGTELSKVLDDYQRKHGLNKRQYAEGTLNSWRTGQRQMSGKVATRLFDLLPRHMPLKKKFDLVESLWKFSGDSSSKTLYIGKDATTNEVTERVISFFDDKVKSYLINGDIRNRFDWLAGDDSMVCQKLQNHFMHLYKKQTSRISYDRIGVMLEQFKRSDVQQQSLKQTFTVGKHSIVLVFNDKVEGITENAPNEQDWGCLIMIVGAAILFVIILASG